MTTDVGSLTHAWIRREDGHLVWHSNCQTISGDKWQEFVHQDDLTATLEWFRDGKDGSATVIRTMDPEDGKKKTLLVSQVHHGKFSLCVGGFCPGECAENCDACILEEQKIS